MCASLDHEFAPEPLAHALDVHLLDGASAVANRDQVVVPLLLFAQTDPAGGFGAGS